MVLLNHKIDALLYQQTGNPSSISPIWFVIAETFVNTIPPVGVKGLGIEREESIMVDRTSNDSSDPSKEVTPVIVVERPGD